MVKSVFLLAALLIFAGAAGVAQAAQPRFCFGCNFAGAALGGQDFSDVVYVGSNFAGASLRGASFRGAKLVAANFQGADLSQANFDESECTACNFSETNLDGATFTSTRMVAANFAGFSAKVTEAALRALLSACYACNFRGASLAGRDLSGVPMLGVDLSQADLRNVKFDGAVLCWYVVNGTQRSTKCVTMQGARVAGASFAGALICVDPVEAESCTAVTAAQLRRDSGSSLDGAILP